MRKPFFPVGLNLEGRKCVVIGNDREAKEKSESLLESGANLHRIEDSANARENDLAGAYFVISTPQDEALSARLRALADKHKFLLCCIDQPKYGFVAMAAVAKSGPVRVAILTAGLAPRVGKILKESLQRAMDGRFSAFVEILARRRERTREEHPRAEDSNIRRREMIDAAEGFEAHVSFAYPEWFKDG